MCPVFYRFIFVKLCNHDFMTGNKAGLSGFYSFNLGSLIFRGKEFRALTILMYVLKLFIYIYSDFLNPIPRFSGFTNFAHLGISNDD